MRVHRLARLMAGVVLLFGAVDVAAAQSASTAVSGSRVAGDQGSWTDEQMRAAKPLDLGRAGRPGDAGRSLPAPAPADASIPPFKPATEPVSMPGQPYPLPPVDADGPSGPRSIGPTGLPYTTSLVAPDSLVQVWPYRIAGKLFFKDGGAGYSCTAAIISKRLVMTAAHCVYNTNFNRWHTNFAFVPAYNAGLSTQPFGQWSASRVYSPTGWINGCECFPNSYDFAVVEIVDRTISGRLQTIGGYLGSFGWQSGALVGRNVTQLGYPGNLESGRRMTQNNGQVVSAGVAGRVGTAMEKGSSGGPWVQDFGVRASGQTIVGGGSNQIVGVTSYGQPGQHWAGATILNAAWVSMWNSACAAKAGNC